ncbi:hypothetical protein CPB84DRAFT_1787760 [Gymnopilus junonius]|uniref:Uncharacterized protein n=1 Tax=Gymnopilus junonius TaxID=109634 RepID=A0A9P5NET7_GYMJU|nr:hypothetical protein CPB84DRAFT_1787760 [Gymnopilus junonius]
MDSVNNKRPTLAIRTTSPLAELNDGSTARTLTPKPRFDPMRSFRNSFRSRQDENDDPSMSRRQWKGKEKAIVVDEAEESRESKVAVKAREIRAWMMGKSGSDIHRSTAYPDHRQDKGETSYATKTRQTVGGFFKNRRRDTSRLDRGPKPGQTYEIVNRRIVENSPEKTVEISTWREHAVEQANDDEDKMSIYYINADEYTREGFYANEANPKVEWRMEGSVVSQADRLGSNTGSTSPPYLNPGNQADMNIPQVEKQQQRSKSPYKQATTPRAGTISPSTSEKDPEPEQNASTNSRVKVSSRRESGSRQSTSRRRGRYKESTPIEKDLPKSSFHPTRSGSTISSIKSEATLELEAILMNESSTLRRWRG